MFEKFRRIAATQRLVEVRLYDEVAQELAKGELHDGIWAKALADSDGVEAKARALYLRYRVQSIKDKRELLEPAAVEAINQAAKARAFGLTEEEVSYLGNPIEAVQYLKKYQVSKEKLSRAITKGAVRGVLCNGVLWVQDRPL